jgi:hypothetical protein
MYTWSSTFLISVVSAFVLTPVVFVYIGIAGAQVMESANYGIQSDSINFGGGLSDSAGFSLQSSAGEIATGESTSASYVLRAGYQQMQQVFISLTGLAAVTLSPNIPGVSGGVANGSTTATVVTDSPSGYSLTIESQSAPAMVSGVNSLADYNTNTNPDYEFAIGVTDAHFGFSPFGDDIIDRFKNNGASCGVGSTISNLNCWTGASTTATVIAESTSSNHPTGTDTRINFRVGVGGSVTQAPGVYVATSTVTALPL